MDRLLPGNPPSLIDQLRGPKIPLIEMLRAPVPQVPLRPELAALVDEDIRKNYNK